MYSSVNLANWAVTGLVSGCTYMRAEVRRLIIGGCALFLQFLRTDALQSLQPV